MKDIDFDELDRAVSSVLETPADVQPAVTPTTPAAEPAEAPEPAATVVETPAAAEAPAEPAPVETAAAAKTPLAIKRRGQFMDVVHPSSDMTGKPEETTTTSSRTTTLQPLSASVVPDAEPTTTPDVETTPEPTPAADEISPDSQPPVETVGSAPADHAAPDPLDVMQTQEEAQDAAATETSTLEDTPVDSSAEETAEEPVEEPAPTTPFLADTEVDKRPLGAFSPEEAPVEESAAAPNMPVTAEPLPPELQADVVAVEANPSDKSEEAGEKVVETEDKSEAVEPGLNTSIPQQYAATESNADGDHSIFDTSEYHQPIAPVKTKKRGLPGWLVALLVFFILAGLSAAGGYFWFYYGL